MSGTRPNASTLPPRVVCVHGAGGGGWEWTIWKRVFAAHGWPISAPDLLPEKKGLAATTFEDYRAQVLGWCGDSNPQGCILIGASLGGLLALSIAAEVDARALLLVNPLPPTGLINTNRDVARRAIIPWGSERSLAGTRRAMPDADDAACLFAWQRWRDESGLALEQARRGINTDRPTCPILVMASDRDNDVPPLMSRELAVRHDADFICLHESSHVGPLLGRQAADAALHAVHWLARSLSSLHQISARS